MGAQGFNITYSLAGPTEIPTYLHEYTTFQTSIEVGYESVRRSIDTSVCGAEE